jgi:hypothetical protein
MRHLIIAAAALTLAGFALPFAGTASAEIEYPYCARGNDGGGGGGCSYATIEQCRAFAFGAGYCYDNPRYTPSANASVRSPRPRR